MKTTLVTLITIVFFTGKIFSQEGMETVFSKSYACEYRQHYDSAIAFLRTGNIDNNYEVNLRLGWLHYLSGKHEQSIGFYKKAKSIMPVSIEPHLGIVYPLSALEKWNEVLLEYDGIIKLDAKNYTANFKAGLIYYNRKDYTLAKKYLDVLLNLFPFDYEVVHLSAWNHLMMGNYREARVLFQKALCIRPGDVSSNEGLRSIK
ncbi:MAG: tetratricopeptide repeat protein [Bacteroidota bacterium]|jgi:tetratricopeptide (TPR) repeat protein